MSAGHTHWPGTRIGNIIVLEPTDQRKGGYYVWRCICDCGKQIYLDTRTLQRRTVTDCGCITKVKPGQKDMTGQRYGRLVCLYPEEGRNSSGSTIWRCRCDCGNECSVPRSQLVSGYTLSCGCLGHPPLKDYVGKTFGYLTVLEYAGKRRGLHHWRCQCKCGKICEVGQTNLQKGKTKSCGCISNEKLRERLKLRNGTSVRILEETLSGKLRSNNTSGYTGVYNAKGNRWIARIEFKGRQYHLGAFDTKQEAIAARKEGEIMFRECIDEYYQELEDGGEQRENPEKNKKHRAQHGQKNRTEGSIYSLNGEKRV